MGLTVRLPSTSVKEIHDPFFGKVLVTLMEGWC